MAGKWNHLKLGIFVISALIILVIGLYLVGKDTNLFGKNYSLRVQFPNVQGLTVGHNVRYAGIQVGTVKKVEILNDSTIEVTMLIEERMKQYIHREDIASLGTDGIMGNRLINIVPAAKRGPLANEGDLLQTRQIISMDAMLETLSITNNNLAIITRDLQETIQRINNSKALWAILNDQSLPANLRASLQHIHQAASNADAVVQDVQTIIADVKDGKGSVGSLLRDSTFSTELIVAVEGIQQLEIKAGSLADDLKNLTKNLDSAINQSAGPANTILYDTSMVRKLHQTLTNIEAGTSSFAENMEALKHNFLFRGYFKKLEKEQKKEAEKAARKN